MERVVGFHPVREALRARRRHLHRLRYRAGLRRAELEELLALARAAGVPVAEEPERDLLDGLPPGIRSQGLVLEAGPLPTPDLLSLVAAQPASRLEGVRAGRWLVVLDGVEDPQNLGAVARVAEGAGALGLVLGARRAPPLSPAVSRASAGAIEHLPVCRVTNLRRALSILKGAGFWVIGAEAEEGIDLFDTPDRIWSGDLALVFGSEERGIRPGVSPQLDHRVRIPLVGRVESLNVAAAAAVVLFEGLRRTRSPGGSVATQGASPRN